MTVITVHRIKFPLYKLMRRKIHEQRCGSGRGGGGLHGPGIVPSKKSLALFLSGGIVISITGPLVYLKVRQKSTGCGLGRPLSNAVAVDWAGGASQVSRSMWRIYRGYSVHFV